MTYEPRARKWDWRSCLTPEEHAEIARGDLALAAVEAARRDAARVNIGRQAIINRAVQRAKHRGLRIAREPAKGIEV